MQMIRIHNWNANNKLWKTLDHTDGVNVYKKREYKLIEEERKVIGPS